MLQRNCKRYFGNKSITICLILIKKQRLEIIGDYNKNIYIFGIAMDKEEKKVKEANKIYDVEKVFPSIYLAMSLVEINFN